MPGDIGVVIPTYNRVTETVRAVDSVLAQTVPVSEVVVVDDGSPEPVREALRGELHARDVQLIECERRGHPGIARNAGIHALKATWVAFLDSDDHWLPHKLEHQLDGSVDHVAVCSNAHRSVEGSLVGLVHETLPPTLTFGTLVARNLIVNSTVIIRREVLQDVGFVAESYLVRGCEDYATWLRVATRHEWRVINEPLVVYRDEPANSIRGTEVFSSHPSREAALLDYVAWRRHAGRPLQLSERITATALPLMIRAETRLDRARWRHHRGEEA